MQRRQHVNTNAQPRPKVHPAKSAPVAMPGPAGLVSGPIPVGHPKISLPIPVAMLPLELFIPEPAPQPEVTLRLVAASGVELHARIAGKSFRRCIKAIVADGPLGDDRLVVLQGRLAAEGTIEEAGLAYTPKPRGGE